MYTEKCTKYIEPYFREIQVHQQTPFNQYEKLLLVEVNPIGRSPDPGTIVFMGTFSRLPVTPCILMPAFSESLTLT